MLKLWSPLSSQPLLVTAVAPPSPQCHGLSGVPFQPARCQQEQIHVVILHLSQITFHMFLSPLNRDGVMEGLSQTRMQTRREDLEVTSPGDSFFSLLAKPSGVASIYGSILRPCPSGMQAELGTSPLDVANSSVS